MDAPLREGEDSNLYDVLRSGESPRPDKDLMQQSLNIEIVRALETLSPREADVVKLYYGITLKYNYEEQFVDLSMPRYIKNILHQFQFLKSIKPIHIPHIAPTPSYSKTVQLITPESTISILSSKKYKTITTNNRIIYILQIRH